MKNESENAFLHFGEDCAEKNVIVLLLVRVHVTVHLLQNERQFTLNRSDSKSGFADRVGIYIYGITAGLECWRVFFVSRSCLIR